MFCLWFATKKIIKYLMVYFFINQTIVLVVLVFTLDSLRGPVILSYRNLKQN